ncbi:MAG: ferredoxin, partial [Candidatus Aminicenantes bacterium]|nr:ferredoxin [Candidatus Aminicenantes bacterium]
IDPEKCTECVGSHEESQCKAVCPVDACIPDPEKKETREELETKYKRLHG